MGWLNDQFWVFSANPDKSMKFGMKLPYNMLNEFRRVDLLKYACDTKYGLHLEFAVSDRPKFDLVTFFFNIYV